MSKEKRSFFLSSTRNEISRLYDEISVVMKDIIQQPPLTIKPAEFNTILLLLDRNLLESETFRDYIKFLKTRAKKLVGLYIPEEEDVISKLRELKEDKKAILKVIREYERRREREFVDEIKEIEKVFELPIEIEVLHKPRIEAITDICRDLKPDIIVISKDYYKERDMDLSPCILELIHKIKCSLLIIG